MTALGSAKFLAMCHAQISKRIVESTDYLDAQMSLKRLQGSSYDESQRYEQKGSVEGTSFVRSAPDCTCLQINKQPPDVGRCC